MGIPAAAVAAAAGRGAVQPAGLVHWQDMEVVGLRKDARQGSHKQMFLVLAGVHMWILVDDAQADRMLQLGVCGCADRGIETWEGT